MRVKRYVVDTMPEALEKIKVELGKDAIILNTKPLKTGGFLGLFGKQQIEVIAAVDEKEREKAESARQAARPLQTSNNVAAKRAYQGATAAKGQSTGVIEREPYKDESIRPPIGESRSVAEFARQFQESLHPSAEPVRQSHEQIREVAAAAGHLQEKLRPTAVPAQRSQESASDVQESRRSSDKTNTGNTPVKMAGKQARETESSDDNRIANELRDMREMFQKLLLLKETNNKVPGPILLIRDRLLAQGVEEELVAIIMKKMLLLVEDPAAVTDEEACEHAAAIIRTMLTEASPEPARIDRSVKYAFFFGPTGVGKTTTIAKLAAESMLKEKRKVGFITSDTFRIAAVEQLKTYANILNVPLEVVFSPKEIEQAMERLGNCDLIFVDTAGRNYRNNEYVKGIKELLQYGEKTVNFLVMSLTSKYADMKAILDQFHDLPGGRAIFTKADETDAYGSIFNVTQEYHLSLSYITTGQNVPDDITLATSEMVTTMIVGEKTYA